MNPLLVKVVAGLAVLGVLIGGVWWVKSLVVENAQQSTVIKEQAGTIVKKERDLKRADQSAVITDTSTTAATAAKDDLTTKADQAAAKAAETVTKIKIEYRDRVVTVPDQGAAAVSEARMASLWETYCTVAVCEAKK